MTADNAPALVEQQFLELLAGKWIVQAISTAAELGIADRLTEPLTAAQLAQELGCLSDPLERLLRVLTGEGLLEKDRTGKYSLTSLGTQLRSENLGLLAEFVGSPSQWTPWVSLTQAMRSGECAFEATHGRTLFEYLKEKPPEARLYDRAVDVFTRRQAVELAKLGLLAEGQTWVDVGGGRGTLLLELMAREPGIRGWLVDLPEVVEAARPRFEQAALGDRWKLHAANFFDELPAGGSHYVIKHVLHNWSDDSAIKLLKQCVRAMPRGGKVLVVEGLLLPDGRRNQTALMDLEMLVLTGEGRERSKPEFRRLFSRAGLKLTATHGLGSGAWLLVAEADGGDSG